jgi:hypothetical protein
MLTPALAFNECRINPKSLLCLVDIPENHMTQAYQFFFHGQLCDYTLMLLVNFSLMALAKIKMADYKMKEGCILYDSHT